jgi:hypothetical protein
MCIGELINSIYVFLNLYTSVLVTSWLGWDSSVGTATLYGVDGKGIESRLGRNFPHLSRSAVRPTQPHIQGVPGIYRG